MINTQPHYRLGADYERVGRYDKAVPLLKKTPAQYCPQGADHRSTLTAMNNLAFAFAHTGEVARQLLCMKAVDLKTKTLGEMTETLIFMNNLGELFRKLVKLPKAIPLLEGRSISRKQKLRLADPKRCDYEQSRIGACGETKVGSTGLG
jgi:hypothetical protein